MTMFAYTVVNRPKKDAVGRTNISWAAECGREAVALGGYLVTSRTKKGEDRNYIAYMHKADAEGNATDTLVGDGFTTRAQAAFAIWRSYYSDWRATRNAERSQREAQKLARREERAKRRAYRETPEGREAYRLELNRKARERRANMTAEEKAAEAAKRRAKREQAATVASYTS